MTILPFFEFSLYQMFLIFCFWSFIGWGIEVCYMTLETGEYQNRGFLNMPFCPIYGVGVLLVTILFRPINHTIIPLFITSGLLCTAFELSVGLLMEKIFHSRWWDYSHEKFNYKGLICLKVSICWGLGCTFVLRVMEPMVERATVKIPVPVGMTFVVIMSILILVDLTITLATIIHLNDRLKQIDELSKLFITNSIVIGSGLAGETLEVKAKYDKLVNNIDGATKRLLNAFPNMKSTKYNESVSKLRKSIKEKIHNINNK